MYVLLTYIVFVYFVCCGPVLSTYSISALLHVWRHFTTPTISSTVPPPLAYNLPTQVFVSYAYVLGDLYNY